MSNAFSRIEASKSAAKTRVADAFKNEAGAFDLPSILVGVVVVGILTAGVLASIFGVIPFAQDKGAQQDLGAAVTAQGVYLAQAKESGWETKNTYALNLAKLQADPANLLGDDLTESDILIEGNTGDFWAVTESGSGKFYAVSDSSTTPVHVTVVDGGAGVDGIAGNADDPADTQVTNLATAMQAAKQL